MSKVATSSYEYNPIQEWEEFLGEVDMHYHYGIHGDFKASIRNLIFPHVCYGSKVLDAGCGWGGPARMLRDIKGCTVHCLTNSPSQHKYLEGEFKTIDADLEIYEPTERYDVIMHYETMCYVNDKDRLINAYNNWTDNLVMVEYYSKENKSYSDMWDFYLHPLDNICESISNNGFTVVKCDDLPYEDYLIPSVSYWYSRLKDMPVNFDTQLGVVKRWCADVLSDNGQNHLSRCGLAAIAASKL